MSSATSLRVYQHNGLIHWDCLDFWFDNVMNVCCLLMFGGCWMCVSGCMVFPIIGGFHLLLFSSIKVPYSFKTQCA